MKTKHHLLKILAATFFLIFYYGSVYSQNVISSVNVSESAKIINEIVTQEQETIDLINNNFDNWMSNKSYLDNNSSLTLSLMKMELDNNVFESERQIESWMTDDQFWDLNDSEIEDWMLDDNFWKIESEDDNNLIEPWMLDDKFWVLVN